jgi:hypothetical protein
MNKMTAAETAWVAGVFEGEGTFTYRTYSGTGRNQITLRIVMTDLDVIERLHTLTGVGNLYGPYTSKQLKQDGTKRKSSYHWAITTQSDVIALGNALYPWLGERRKAKFLEVKKYYEEGKQFATKANGKWKGPQRGNDEHNNDTTTTG